jgi:chromosome segregation ATPase
VFSVEKKESELKKNMQIVVGDKAKIEETIEQLDVLKLEALENTWTKVSKCVSAVSIGLLSLTYFLQRLW